MFFQRMNFQKEALKTTFGEAQLQKNKLQLSSFEEEYEEFRSVLMESMTVTAARMTHTNET